MKSEARILNESSEAGFTLIELLVVVLIIGILAAIAVPQYFKVIEKSRAAEATSSMDSIRGSQERYLAQFDAYYTGSLTKNCYLDVCSDGGAFPTLKYFSWNADIAAGTTSPSWTVTAERTFNGAAYDVAGFGKYTITYDVEPGAAPAVSATCPSDTTNCAADLGIASQ